MDTLQIALAGLLILIVFAFIYYVYPNILIEKYEGFATIAIEANEFPKCLARSADGQRLLSILYAYVKMQPPASQSSMAYDELKLIVQKALCMDADITGMGMGPYTTYALPYNTQHDIEPVASFVGRCMRNAVRSQDISVLFDKMTVRGNELIQQICPTSNSRQTVFDLFHNVMKVSARAISINCLREQPIMDIPSGVRDPGYYMPPELTRVSEYKEYGR